MKVEHVGALSIKCDAMLCGSEAKFTVRLRLTPSMLQVSHFCDFCKDMALSTQAIEEQKAQMQRTHF
jgi:hypothetical protein